MHDPVCMMEVGLREAGAMAIHEGRAYYFCNSGCHEKFVANPALLVDRLIEEYTGRHYRRPSCFCTGSSAEHPTCLND